MRSSNNIKNSSIKELVAEDYLKFKNLDSNCPDLYLDKVNYDRLNKKLINFNYKDNRLKTCLIVTKDMCDDSVIFDNSFNDRLLLISIIDQR